jgi:hypothetical protein
MSQASSGPGSWCRIRTGRTFASIADRAEAQLDHPCDINSWGTDESGAFRGTIAKPLNPREFGIET